MAAPVIKMTVDPASLRRIKSDLDHIRNGAARVLSRGINKTLAGVKTDAVNEISNEITPTKTEIRKAFKLFKASISSLSASVECRGKPLPLMKYKARSVAAGVTFQIRKTDKRMLLPGGFIATMSSGHKGVFHRVHDGPRAPTRKRDPRFGAMPRRFRLPIVERFGPRVPDILSNEPVLKQVGVLANQRLDKNLAHELDYLLSQAP